MVQNQLRSESARYESSVYLLKTSILVYILICQCKEDCFKQWKDQAKTSRREVTCVYCRAEWPEDAPFKGGAAKSKGAKMNEGYMNLGSLQPGLSSTRGKIAVKFFCEISAITRSFVDTSSYNSYWYDRY